MITGSRTWLLPSTPDGVVPGRLFQGLALLKSMQSCLQRRDAVFVIQLVDRFPDHQRQHGLPTLEPISSTVRGTQHVHIAILPVHFREICLGMEWVSGSPSICSKGSE